MERVNLVDYGISTKTVEEKRQFLFNLDYQLKYIHDNDGYVREVDSNNIFVDINNGFPYFEEIFSISKGGFDDPNEIKKVNLLWLANLAVCLYLPEYNLENGLMSLDVLVNNFDKIKSYIPTEDLDYYHDVFTNSNSIMYYSDYIQKQNNSSSRLASNAMQYIKSTPAGRAMAINDNESGIANYVFITCFVFALLILVLGLVIYLL